MARPSGVRTALVVAGAMAVVVAVALLWPGAPVPAARRVVPVPPPPREEARRDLPRRPDTPDPPPALPPVLPRPSVEGEDTSSSVRIVLQKDQGGAPIADGEVALSGIFPSRWREVKGQEGDWLVQLPKALLTDERMTVNCSAPGHLRLSRSLKDLAATAREEEGRLTIRIPLSAATGDVARLRIVDHDSGAPVDAAEVGELTQRGLGPFERVAVSDRDGIAFVPLRAGGWHVAIQKPGYLLGWASVPGEPADLGDVPIVKDRFLGTLRIQVVDSEDRKGWPGWVRIDRVGPALDSAEFAELTGGVPGTAFGGSVERLSRRGAGRTGPWSWCVRSPRWECDGLIPGRYAVVAFSPERGFSRRLVTVLGAPLELLLPLGEGTRVDIRRGPWDADVRVALVPGKEVLGIQESDGDSFHHVLPGKYSVELRFPGGILKAREGFEVPESAFVLLDLADMRLPRTRVQGRLLANDGGPAPSGVPGVVLRIGGGEQVLEVRTSESGEFAIPDARPGKYLIRVVGYTFEHRARREFEVPLNPPDSVDVGEFSVSRAPGQ